MSVSRWKVMACTLGLSLGGLAICAGQSNDRLNAPVNPATPTPTDPPPILLPEPPRPSLPSVAPETLPPLQIPTPPAREIEIDIPRTVVPVQSTAPLPPVSLEIDLPVVAANPAVAPETLPMPRVMVFPVAPSVQAPPTIAPPVITPPEPRVENPAPPALPPMNRPAESVPPPATVIDPPQPTPPPVITPPAPPVIERPALPPQPQPQPVTAAPATSKLKMLMRLGDGTPRFEIRTSDSVELLLKVYGQKVEMQSAPEGVKASPIAGVTAIGKVRFTGPGIEGTCDQLTVLSGTGEVMLKGNVHVKTKRGKTWSEMTTEKMIYQIGAAGLTTPTAHVVPVGYQRD